MTKEKFNGWSNYETWCVALWIDNESDSYHEWQEQSRECYAEEQRTEHAEHEFGTVAERAACELALRLKLRIEEAAPVLTASLYGDLLSAALSEVDWYEIALNRIEEIASTDASNTEEAAT